MHHTVRMAPRLMAAAAIALVVAAIAAFALLSGSDTAGAATAGGGAAGGQAPTIQSTGTTARDAAQPQRTPCPGHDGGGTQGSGGAQPSAPGQSSNGSEL